MITYLLLIFVLFVGLLIYSVLPPKHLRDIPTVPLLPFVYSFIISEPDDLRVEKYILPALDKHGVAKVSFHLSLLDSTNLYLIRFG